MFYDENMSLTSHSDVKQQKKKSNIVNFIVATIFYLLSTEIKIPYHYQGLMKHE